MKRKIIQRIALSVTAARVTSLALRRALECAHPVEAILLLELIKQAAELEQRIAELNAALNPQAPD